MMPRRPATFCSIRTLCLVAALLSGMGMLAACDRSPESSSSTPPHPAELTRPRDGIGVRSGVDVTGQPGRMSPPMAQAPVVDERPVILAFGDSLTAGLGVSPEESYPAQLQRRMDEAGYRYRVMNAGVSGETTAGAMRRIEWALKSRPSIVIIEFGGNDGLRGLDLRQTRENLESIMRRFQQAGVTVVLAGMRLPPNYGQDYIDQFARLYADLAKASGVTFMPFFLEGVAGQPSLNQADGIHPTGAGYRIIADRLLKVLAPHLTVGATSGSTKGAGKT